jgi:hypothetical protein
MIVLSVGLFVSIQEKKVTFENSLLRASGFRESNRWLFALAGGIARRGGENEKGGLGGCILSVGKGAIGLRW